MQVRIVRDSFGYWAVADLKGNKLMTALDSWRIAAYWAEIRGHVLIRDSESDSDNTR